MSDEQTQMNAIVKATAIGELNTFTSLIECSTDLPPDPIGEVVVEAIAKLWKAGEDPAKCTVVLTFGCCTPSKTGDEREEVSPDHSRQ